MTRSSRASRRRGHAIVELSLMMPWIFFLFVGALDFGFYAYAMISVENATRVAALGASMSESAASDYDQACRYVRDELSRLPNVAGKIDGCGVAPLKVQVTRVVAADSGVAPVLNPPPGAARVTVTYDTLPLIPIPGLMTGKLTIMRTAEMRITG
jgi:Flp pilus assembly protein TadG